MQQFVDDWFRGGESLRSWLALNFQFFIEHFMKIKNFLIILNIGLALDLLEEHFALGCLRLGFCACRNVDCAASSLFLLVDLRCQFPLFVQHVAPLYLVKRFKS